MNKAAASLSLSDVRKIFRQGERRLDVLAGASLEVEAGELVALVGPSGSGKSTLLHIAGLLEHGDGGSIRILGQDCGDMNDRERTRVRRKSVGFVYQHHHLLPEFSALENVVLPQMIDGQPRRQARERAAHLLDTVGLSDRLDHRPARLSGGEQQRVAIVRALANGPALLLADEPTGNLDPHTAAHVFEHLRGLVKDEGLAALVATHNFDLADKMDRTLTLDDGRIVPA